MVTQRRTRASCSAIGGTRTTEGENPGDQSHQGDRSWGSGRDQGREAQRGHPGGRQDSRNPRQPATLECGLPVRPLDRGQQLAVEFG